ncbi:alpha/beta hydrolase [Nakamurella flavida]|uniref:alpha/beta hydrolase n=1 Tax=Nakamurella flavida TaxID=363630 RepID=UPI001963D492|nr:alpha/beta hydrolase [Nakamurella flavida]
MPSPRAGTPRRRRVRPLAAFALAAALLTGAVACSIGPSTRPELATSGPGGELPPPTSAATTGSSVPVGPGGSGRESAPVQWTTCDPEVPADGAGAAFAVDCASVQVARDDSGGFDSFFLEIARARAPGLPDDAPTLVVLRDDPGRLGRSAVAQEAAALSPDLQAGYAVVTVDLVGTGASSATDCVSETNQAGFVGLPADPSTGAGAAAVTALSRSLAFDCTDLVGPGLTQANTTFAADDLDTVRAALGTPTLALLGRGYGATLAAVYADRYPGRVGSVVLDGPWDPAATPGQRAATTGAALERSLDAFAAACPGFPGGCALGDDPRAAVQGLVQSLDAADGRGGQLTGGGVLLLLSTELGDPDGWPALADDLAGAQIGDPSALTARLYLQQGGSDSAELTSDLLLYACNDSAERLTGDTLAAAFTQARAAAPLFGPYLVGRAALCSSWPAPEVALGTVRATGAAPIVVLGAVGDPVSPYVGVQAVTGQLAPGTAVSWQSGRHGSYPASACVTAAVDGYLLTARAPARDTLCPP